MHVHLIDHSRKGRAACGRDRVKKSIRAGIPRRGRIGERLYIDTVPGRGSVPGMPEGETMGDEGFLSDGKSDRSIGIAETNTVPLPNALSW